MIIWVIRIPLEIVIKITEIIFFVCKSEKDQSSLTSSCCHMQVCYWFHLDLIAVTVKRSSVTCLNGNYAYVNDKHMRLGIVKLGIVSSRYNMVFWERRLIMRWGIKLVHFSSTNWKL